MACRDGRFLVSGFHFGILLDRYVHCFGMVRCWKMLVLCSGYDFSSAAHPEHVASPVLE